MNINEIAELAGVSRATVSRYLNNGYVSVEKKEKIKKVIEDTGYQPSIQAQMLRTKKTGLIGVIVPQIDSPAISRMAEGISHILNDKGYQLLMMNTCNDTKAEIRYLKQLKQNHVDGIIFIGNSYTKEHRKVMKELMIPIVVLSQCVDDFSCVYCDDYGAAKELTRMAMKTGKNMAFIGAVTEEDAAGHGCLYGFLDAHFEQNLAIREEYCISDVFTLEEGYDSAKQLLQMDDTIDTLICAADTIAAGAMLYLQETGKRVPDDVQIVGFGDSNLGKICNPRLTTVHYYYKTSGTEAAKVLIDMIEEDSINVRRELKMGYQIKLEDSLRR